MLFNLYAFSFRDSFQKNVEQNTFKVSLSKDYLIPTLNMINVECKNFLNDYQSLIHIENDNLLTFSQKILKTGSHFGSNQVGGKIHIMSSRFMDSSFTYGMLF